MAILSSFYFSATLLCKVPTGEQYLCPFLLQASCRFRHLNLAQQLTSSFDISSFIFLRLVAQNTASGNLCVANGSTVACDWLTTQTLPAESLAQEQNAVVSTYVNDIVFLSLISK
ncbi:hypothetical protein F511_11409 [Dorcoceras hygrometricum]|uniref:Uncharacterized protein n=1 Tax=Dorcoceras hygrometricum TaxID=472368 RepID=A0A2Z7C7I8_9LAMI|nr:hypothetical protein F511_11409 [Dorcoceras hygrometricum]